MSSDENLCDLFLKWADSAPNLDTKRLVRFGKTDISGMNTSEVAYLSRLARKKGRAWRSGWPDFLVEQDGRFMFVEVKAGNDKVRPNQYATFSALEAAGLRVFVWNPKNPHALTPFQEYGSSRGAPLPESCQDGTRKGKIKALCMLEGTTVE